MDDPDASAAFIMLSLNAFSLFTSALPIFHSFDAWFVPNPVSAVACWYRAWLPVSTIGLTRERSRSMFSFALGANPIAVFRELSQDVVQVPLPIK